MGIMLIMYMMVIFITNVVQVNRVANVPSMEAVVAVAKVNALAKSLVVESRFLSCLITHLFLLFSSTDNVLNQ